MALASLTDRNPVHDRSERAIERSQPGKVTGRLKRALDAMIWQGMTRAEAAKHANLSEHSLYVAMKRPHVLAFHNAELQVLRDSERARSIHRMTELRDQNDNKLVAFNAAKELAGPSDQSSNSPGAMQKLPGLVVILNTSAPTQINATQHLVPSPAHIESSD